MYLSIVVYVLGMAQAVYGVRFSLVYFFYLKVLYLAVLVFNPQSFDFSVFVQVLSSVAQHFDVSLMTIVSVNVHCEGTLEGIWTELM